MRHSVAAKKEASVLARKRKILLRQHLTGQLTQKNFFLLLFRLGKKQTAALAQTTKILLKDHPQENQPSQSNFGLLLVSLNKQTSVLAKREQILLKGQQRLQLRIALARIVAVVLLC